MHGMVREGLDLARSMDSSEKMQALDIDSLLDSVCADAADAGQDVALQGSTRAFVMAQPGALRRCLTNLIDNACKYGKSARVSIALEQQKIAIRIRDQGRAFPSPNWRRCSNPSIAWRPRARAIPAAPAWG
jgi:signal transduction histidine kinase